ncbi:MAG: ribosome biogenesis GTP-binding protein YihA/YsxC [Patescibacteria group bacterium]|jgi:GTP-binding protein|nr:ribosome biogenesis GTP-binding protein YihA/YsxC [Patescibacteria group bacterium]
MTKIKTAQFVKGIIGPDNILSGPEPQLAFVGRSNVGKSSLINSVCGQKGLARSSSSPGRTREINLFLVNNSFYLVDLPGYGYAKLPLSLKREIEKRINWYLFHSDQRPDKVFLVIDAKVGPTSDDLEMFRALESHRKNIVIIMNKLDKVKSSERLKQRKKIEEIFSGFKVIAFSSQSLVGREELIGEILKI